VTPGRALITFGVILTAVGLLLEFAPALRLGRLPGDISFGGSGWRVYIPIATSVLLSIILTVALALFASIGARR
jgi:hypothetical protein